MQINFFALVTNCNCDNSLFTKLPWRRWDLSVLESSCHLPPFYLTRTSFALSFLFLNAELGTRYFKSSGAVATCIQNSGRCACRCRYLRKISSKKNDSIQIRYPIVKFQLYLRKLQFKLLKHWYRLQPSSSSSYLFIYQVTSYHKKKLQLPLGLSLKHRNMQFL